MTDRRTVLTTLAATLAGAPVMRAWAADAMFPGPVTADTPKASVIPGKPPYLDFGDGLKIPCSKAALLTLWESKSFWMTVGVGRSSYSLRAQGEAVKFAVGAMKLLILTLAFAPERLEHVDGCGWRLKVQDAKNYVLGDVNLPGKPFWPINDANSTGFGNADSSYAGAPTSMGGLGLDPAGSFIKVDAFTTYIVKKKDASLQYVREYAQLVTPG